MLQYFAIWALDPSLAFEPRDISGIAQYHMGDLYLSDILTSAVKSTRVVLLMKYRYRRFCTIERPYFDQFLTPLAFIHALFKMSLESIV